MTRSADGALDIGSVLRNTYKIVSVLGRGGMGSVFLAQHLRLPGKQVAVKVLRNDGHLSPDIAARFRREAEIASRLGHPNIVEVLDYDTLEDGSPFLVLEFLRGESLADRLWRGRPSRDEVFSYVRQMGSALQTAHRAGIVHRDLKPANIFLVPTDSGGVVGERVKLLDFGISKVLTSETLQTQEAVLIGTPQYMAPEQALGRNSQIDARTDLFALGVIVFEMFAGQTPFGAGSLTEIIYRIVHEPPASLAGLVPELPAHVIASVERALAKKPDERYPDVGAFIADLTGSPLQSLATAAGEGFGAARSGPSGIARPTDEALSLSGTLAPGSQGGARPLPDTGRSDAPSSDTMNFGSTLAPGSGVNAQPKQGSDTMGFGATLAPGSSGGAQPVQGSGTLGFGAAPVPPDAGRSSLPGAAGGTLPFGASGAAPSPVAPVPEPKPVESAPSPSPVAVALAAPLVAVPVAAVEPQAASTDSKRRRLGVGAVVLLVGGAGLGWMLHSGTPTAAPVASNTPPAVTPPAPSVAQPTPAASPAQPAPTVAQPTPAPTVPTPTEPAVAQPAVAAASATQVKPVVNRPSLSAKAEAVPEEARQFLKDGESALAAGQFEQAMGFARKSQQVQVTAAARSLLARAYCLKRDLGGAKAEFRGVAASERARVTQYCLKYDIDLTP